MTDYTHTLWLLFCYPLRFVFFIVLLFGNCASMTISAHIYTLKNNVIVLFGTVL